VKELGNDKRIANDARRVMKDILQTSKTVMNFVNDIDVVIEHLRCQFDTDGSFALPQR
jgi:hypothetical protein